MSAAPASNTAHSSVRDGLPVATITVWILTALVTGFQLFYPHIVDILRRDPRALAAGEWWRLITPLFVHPDGWPQITFNFITLAALGAMTERLFGNRRWLLLYFISGFVGELAGYAWHPYSAGASVAIAGLVGGLLACLWVRGPGYAARLAAGAGLLGASALTAFRDLHGPPLLAGVGLAALMLLRDESLLQRVRRL